MPSSFFIKPAREGLIVRDPVTRQPLAAEGELKPRDKYWLARRREESVVETQPPMEPALPARLKKSAAEEPAAGGN